MARFYKGVGVGTYLHDEELRGRGPRTNGIAPVKPGGGRGITDIIAHIVYGTTSSPCVSVTKSFAIASQYAIGFGTVWPTPADPAYVYVIDIPDPIPAKAGFDVVDPVAEIAYINRNPLKSTYAHDGDQDFLLGVVNPARFAHHRTALTKRPGPWATPRPANLSLELEAMVRALRDSEVLVIGHIPAACVTDIRAVA
nr:hypothetical protein [uncultured Rhodopila sp.]